MNKTAYGCDLYLPKSNLILCISLTISFPEYSVTP